jgi:hypothetical protein
MLKNVHISPSTIESSQIVSDVVEQEGTPLVDEKSNELKEEISKPLEETVQTVVRSLVQVIQSQPQYSNELCFDGIVKSTFKRLETLKFDF